MAYSILFSEKDLLSKISSLEAEIQVCGENEATCQSNLAKEKNFAFAQKQKNLKLKRVIADTRKNNQILKNQLSKNQCDNSNDIIHENEISKLEDSMEILKKQNEELKMEVEELEKERDVQRQKSLQFQSENLTNREIILELKTAQSKLISDLKNCKTTDADYVISKQELKECNEELEAEIEKSIKLESEMTTCRKTVVAKNRTILEQNTKVERLEKKLNNETEKSLQCQSENTSNLKLIQELQSKQSKMTSDLQDYKSTDADLVISKQELQECNEEMEVQTKKNLQCDSEKKNFQVETVLKNAEILELKSKNEKITSELESESADHIITKKELRNCEEDLENEIQKNKNIQTTASTNRKRAQDCQDKLEDEIEAKEILQLKVKSYRSSWSEWSACSKTCPGVKNRMDKCSSNNKETKPCSDNCSKSGKAVHS